MLQDLIKAYARHIDVSPEYLDDIEAEDGIYSFAIEGRVLCTISEKRRDDSDNFKICMMASLTGELDEAQVIAEVEKYAARLRLTPLFVRGHVIFSEELCVGFSYDIDSEAVNEQNFPAMVDVFVATVMALVTDGEEEDEATEEIINKFFISVPDTDYRRFLRESGISEDDLRANMGALTVDENFATIMEYHDLSGQLILDNSLPCDDQKALLDLLYVNGVGRGDMAVDYRAGRIHVVSALDPKKATADDLVNLILTQRFFVEKAREYIAEGSVTVKDRNLNAIMNALLV